MIPISIDPQLKKIAPKLVLGVVSANVQVTKNSPQLWKEIEKRIKNCVRLLLWHRFMIFRKSRH